MVHYVSNSVNTQTLELTYEQFLEMHTSPQVVATIAEVRRGFPESKRRLPAVCWAAHFTDNHRHAQSARPSGLFCLDIDHVGDARAYYKEHVQGREDECDIVLSEVSPSGDGLHIVALLQPECNTIAENQQLLAGTLGVSYDPVCKDLGRMFYTSTADDILYEDLKGII